MPVMKVKGGWRFGRHGKVYKSKRKAIMQGVAINYSLKRRGKRPHKI